MDQPAYTLEFEKPLRDLSTQLEQLRQQSLENKLDLGTEIAAIEKKISATQREIYTTLSPWQRVQIARHPKRPYALDYINALCDDFLELHGDRQFNDDRALIGGTAFFKGESIMVIAQQKGRDTKEKIIRNFGMPQPEGYRKALRLMKIAEKFGLPVITFIDTPGAYPGIGSEERHVSEAIAVNLREMAMLRIPTISVVVGEGGSGGALGIGVTDRVLIFENSYYSVISPEGCAAILWKDPAAAPKAAEALKLNADQLSKLHVVDDVIPEPYGGAHHDPAKAATALATALQKHLRELRQLDEAALLDQRYERYRHLGTFEEAGAVRS
ncbi:acetyl-CoA carboxylase carboxyltransferase subunit alpha [Opitutaceae bacterium TAV4]|uniref:acetyl-CoA carboxylase carboxyltransferase subunit alpha n=1 Tax=Geminisphaera colitermitum TaxID=1148786 RepID=UPI000158C791|nr:acetyl-CoA carboxylase carboxyltransferase subunit alpha [Geminisphaera colitermitum]RRJ95572.1 acetyl-CoA carboxylase carboxyltransferase subunit alpha [Opitutaceae bacterium TAV4]RRJ99877.1 acetyl-CoA carboxylase carboxyltransferase subunit alpha [Opitutaceae bacterium TAV3]